MTIYSWITQKNMVIFHSHVSLPVYQRLSIHYALILDLSRFRLLGLSISRPATSIFVRACDGCFGRWLSAEAEALMVGSCTDKNRYYTHQSIAARLTHYFPSHRFEWFQPRSGSKGPSTITASDMYTRLDMWPSWKVGTNMGKFTPSAGDDWGFILEDSA